MSWSVSFVIPADTTPDVRCAIVGQEFGVLIAQQPDPARNPLQNLASAVSAAAVQFDGQAVAVKTWGHIDAGGRGNVQLHIESLAEAKLKPVE